jgi:large subunit ribosomal protein L4e
MFAPLKTFRRWHRKVNLKQKRHAVASALAASAVTPLVQARGHQINSIPSLPLVVDNNVEGLEKTKDVVAFLKRIGGFEDVQRVLDNSSTRPGVGKRRYHATKVRRGPLFIYSNENSNLIKAVRNLPGVDICNVNRLNLKLLAPGGHLGRFIIYTESAFKALDGIFGNYEGQQASKSGFNLHRTVVTNPDIARIINSNEIQSALRNKKANTTRKINKLNPYKNTGAMEEINPYRINVARMEKQANESNKKKRSDAIAAKRSLRGNLSKEDRAAEKLRKKNSKAYMAAVQKHLEDAYPQKVQEEDGEEDN